MALFTPRPSPAFVPQPPPLLQRELPAWPVWPGCYTPCPLAAPSHQPLLNPIPSPVASLSPPPLVPPFSFTPEYLPAQGAHPEPEPAPRTAGGPPAGAWPPCSVNICRKTDKKQPPQSPWLPCQGSRVCGPSAPRDRQAGGTGLAHALAHPDSCPPGHPGEAAAGGRQSNRISLSGSSCFLA